MGVVSYRLMDEVEEALNQTFKAEYSTEDTLIFRNQWIKHDDFTLFIEFLENDEIVQIAEMLEKVYRSFPPNKYEVNWSRETPARDFNQRTKESADFVRIVLNLEGPALHKILLLTSGNFILSDENADLVTALAKAKPEWCDDPWVLDRSPNLYSGLKDFYILPTIAVHTMMSSDRMYFLDKKNPLSEASNEEIWPFHLGLKSRDSLNFAVRLMTFFVTDDTELTFAEHLKADFTEVIKTIRSMSGFSIVNNIQDLLLSKNYKTLAESMSILELNALTQMLPHQSYLVKLPTDILRRRTKSMAKNEVAYARGSLSSVSCYMSDEELSKIKGFGALKVFDSALQGARISMEVPPFIYACFAEVISVKGYQQALDILKECSHIKFMPPKRPEVYTATLALIEEYLDSNGDLPFGWFAQMSEHSWVLTSHESLDIALFV
jgi:hypothetical protein